MSMSGLNKVRIFAGNSNPRLAKDICKNLGIPLSDCELTYFANTEVRLRLNESVRDKNIFLIQTGSSENGRSVNDHIIETLALMDTCRRSGCKSITLIIPNFPYARQDKKDSPRGAITSRLIANLLEAAGLTRIVCVELHAACIQGFFNVCCDNLYTTDLIKEYFDTNIFGNDYKEKFVVISPDEGAMKKTRIFANKVGLPFLTMSKERDYEVANTVSKTILLGNPKLLKDKTAIIIDDMLDTGGTILKAVDVLKQYGAKDVIVAVTHGLLSGPALDRINGCDDLKSVIVSDSISQDTKQSKCLKL